MQITTEPVERPAPLSTPQDRQARDRIEQVKDSLVSLCGTLEDRITSLESQMQDMDAALAELGLIKGTR